MKDEYDFFLFDEDSRASIIGNFIGGIFILTILGFSIYGMYEFVSNFF